MAESNLEALQVVAGEAGVAQRDAKGSFQKAERFEDQARNDQFALPNAQYATPNGNQPGMGGSGGQDASKRMAMKTAPAGGGFAGGGGGIGGPGQPGQQSRGRAMADKPATDHEVAQGQAVGRVRNLGAKTFYRKGDRWVDSEVKPEDEAKAVTLEQFSEEFFNLARAQSAQDNQYLTFEEPVTVALNGKVYRVDPPKATDAKP
jgi:Ca-activated chloride channel family protein